MPKYRRNGKVIYISKKSYLTSLEKEINNTDVDDILWAKDLVKDADNEKIKEILNAIKEKNLVLPDTSVDKAYKLVASYKLAGGNLDKMTQDILGAESLAKVPQNIKDEVFKIRVDDLESALDVFDGKTENEIKSIMAEDKLDLNNPTAYSKQEHVQKAIKDRLAVGEYLLAGGNGRQLVIEKEKIDIPNLYQKNGTYNPLNQHSNYTREERRALYQYTASSSINGHLAKNTMTDDYRSLMRNLDSAIKKSEFEKTYRWGKDGERLARGGGGIMIGVPTTLDFKGNPQGLVDYINNNRLGTRNVNVGYTSISRDRDVAKGFSHGEINEIVLEYNKIEKGIHSAYVSGRNMFKPISAFRTSEAETVMQRGVITVPVSARVVKGKVYVKVDVFKPEGAEFEI